MNSVIVKIETVNMGGGSMVDLIHLENGKVIGINDESIAIYNSEDDFYNCDPYGDLAYFLWTR